MRKTLYFILISIVILITANCKKAEINKNKVPENVQERKAINSLIYIKKKAQYIKMSAGQLVLPFKKRSELYRRFKITPKSMINWLWEDGIVTIHDGKSESVDDYTEKPVLTLHHKIESDLGYLSKDKRVWFPIKIKVISKVPKRTKEDYIAASLISIKNKWINGIYEIYSEDDCHLVAKEKGISIRKACP